VASRTAKSFAACIANAVSPASAALPIRGAAVAPGAPGSQPDEHPDRERRADRRERVRREARPDSLDVTVCLHGASSR